MSKTLAIGVVVGASLAGGFHQTIGSAEQKIPRRGDEIKKISTPDDEIRKFPQTW